MLYVTSGYEQAEEGKTKMHYGNIKILHKFYLQPKENNQLHRFYLMYVPYTANDKFIHIENVLILFII